MVGAVFCYAGMLFQLRVYPFCIKQKGLLSCIKRLSVIFHSDAARGDIYSMSREDLALELADKIARPQPQPRIVTLTSWY